MSSRPAGAPPPPQAFGAQRYAPPPPQGSPLPARPYPPPPPNFQAGGGGGAGRGGFPGGGGGGGGGARAGPGAPLRPAQRRAAPDARPAAPYGAGRGAGGGAGAAGAEAERGGAGGARARRLAERVLSWRVRSLVPESQAYMDLLAFERKLDHTLARKRLDIQETLKRPAKLKRKLRIFISNTFYPGQGDSAVASWELRVEGRLLDDSKPDSTKVKRKFSSFFKSLVIELDKELYGPDNHLVEWHRTLTTQETDGFQVKRPGYKNVRCTILLLLDYQPLQFKLDARLARLLGVHTQARPVIVNALWQYIKTHNLQEAHEREWVSCDKYLEQIFSCRRMKLAEVPARLAALLHAPDPIVINHVIAVEGSPSHDNKQTACYDIDVEVEDSLKSQMSSFLASTSNQQEIAALDNKIHETVESINQLKTNREFLLAMSREPLHFVHRWLASQARDLQTLSGGAGGAGAGSGGAGAGSGGAGEEARGAGAWAGAWGAEGVARYLTRRVAARRRDLERALHAPAPPAPPAPHTPHPAAPPLAPAHPAAPR